jgi:hypothetical protein
MRILTAEGVEDLELETFRARSIVGQHWNAIQHFLATGETDSLDLFQDLRIRGRRLLIDPDEIEQLARIGELDVDEIYEEPR